MGKIEELFSTFLEDSISDHTFGRTYEICEELGFSHFLTKMQIEEDIIYIIDILKRIFKSIRFKIRRSIEISSNFKKIITGIKINLL